MSEMDEVAGGALVMGAIIGVASSLIMFGVTWNIFVAIGSGLLTMLIAYFAVMRWMAK
jgi:hypothetical protein